MKRNTPDPAKQEPADKIRQLPRLRAQRIHELDMDYRRHIRRLQQIVQLFKARHGRTKGSPDT